MSILVVMVVMVDEHGYDCGYIVVMVDEHGYG